MPIASRFLCFILTATLSNMVCAETLPMGKKGVGLAESAGLGADQLSALQVAWFYNWGTHTRVQQGAEFVPMAFSAKRVGDLPAKSRFVLGFNEPDNPKQAHITPETAFQAWPALVDKAEFSGAPALAKNPLSSGSWLSAFLALGASVDFITVHWYKGIDARKFIADLQAICTAYRKPVWVTEFAPQTAAQAREAPQKYSQPEVDAFMREATRWMATSPCVQRYAWHDAKTGTSALFDSGQLTRTGKTYAAIAP